MQNENIGADAAVERTFVEGIDFYFEDGLMVLTRSYLVSRGSCCSNNCRYCPYEDEGSSKASEQKDL